MSDPYSFLTLEQERHLNNFIEDEFSKVDEPDMRHLINSGILYPDVLPDGWDTLPDEWDTLMSEKGIINLENYELEQYLEKWLRLIGYSHWVKGIREARAYILRRCADYVKDYIFAHASGGREQKAAIAGSHPLYKKVQDRLSLAEQHLFELNGMIYKWEKIEFSISRAITNRQGNPSR